MLVLLLIADEDDAGVAAVEPFPSAWVSFASSVD